MRALDGNAILIRFRSAQIRRPLAGPFSWRRRSESNRWIADLQSAALPLGYGALLSTISIND